MPTCVQPKFLAREVRQAINYELYRQVFADFSPLVYGIIVKKYYRKASIAPGARKGIMLKYAGRVSIFGPYRKDEFGSCS